MNSTLTAADVREIVETIGFSHAEFCVEQAETQGDVRDAREELDRIFNEMALADTEQESDR